MIVGHEQVLETMASPAPVMLFIGPRGVGKMTVARHLCVQWQMPEATFVRNLDMDTARALVRRVGTAPHQGHRLIVLRLSQATVPVRVVLLKMLEEAVDTNFILLDENVPVSTITSRAQIRMLHPLTHEQVAMVLRQQGYGDKKARALAALSDGTVRSVRAAEPLLEAKASALAAVRAIAEQDPVALDKLSTKWTEEHTNMLRRWVHEVLSRDFRLFSEADALLPRPMALKILIALSSNVRPRLQVRAGLMGLVIAA